MTPAGLVALKVLSAPVDASRLHRVFVFGAWEIDGELVIAMELMRDTLANWWRCHESLATTAAVDAVLDVIAGLDAVACAGIFIAT